MKDMKGLFFVVKGQYRKGVAPSFVNKVSGDTQYIGGYDPTLDTTSDWYMVLDKKTFNCVSCGGNFDKVIRGVYNTIKRFKGSGDRYLKHVREKDSKVSPIMRCLYEQVYSEYGDFYNEEVEEMEDLAYSDLKEERPLNKAMKLVSKNKPKKTLKVSTPKEEKVIETPTLKKVSKSKVKLGVKKLSVN